MKDYTIESFSRTGVNGHIAETAGEDGGEMTLDLTIFYLSIKWFQDMTNALFKRLAPLLDGLDPKGANYYVAMPSYSDLGATKTASTKTKSNCTRQYRYQEVQIANIEYQKKPTRALYNGTDNKTRVISVGKSFNTFVQNSVS